MYSCTNVKIGDIKHKMDDDIRRYTQFAVTDVSQDWIWREGLCAFPWSIQEGRMDHTCSFLVLRESRIWTRTPRTCIQNMLRFMVHKELQRKVCCVWLGSCPTRFGWRKRVMSCAAHSLKRAEMWALYMASSSPSGLAVTYTDNYVGVQALSSGEATCIGPAHQTCGLLEANLGKKQLYSGIGMDAVKKVCGAVS